MLKSRSAHKDDVPVIIEEVHGTLRKASEQQETRESACSLQNK